MADDNKISIRDLKLQWVLPTELKDQEDIFIHVQGLSIFPVPDFLDWDSRYPGEFYPDKVHKVFDEQEEVIGIVVGGFYLIEEQFLDNPRIVARSALE